MAQVLKGAPVAAALTESLRAETAALRERGIAPCLAIVRIGERESDAAYVRGAMKRCETVGIAVKMCALRADASQEEVVAALRALGAAEEVHGILLLRPLPPGMDDAAVRAALPPEKDVEGVTDGAMALLYAGRREGFAPCTAEACLALLRHYGIPMAGKHAVVIGRSLVVGRPAAHLLLGENATVTVCHSKSEGLAEICRTADILIAAAGREGLIGREHLRAGQTVLDVGIHVHEDGSMCGDVRFDEAAGIVDAITPVPGGVGAVTSAILASHVVRAVARRS